MHGGQWRKAANLLLAVWAAWAAVFASMHLWLTAPDGVGLTALALAGAATLATILDAACRR